MRISLGPRTSEFFELFARAGENALETARAVQVRFRDHPNSAVTQADVKKLEHQGDQLTADLIQLLNTQYVTPFDREDIYQLATPLDDVVDHLDEASGLLDVYGIEAASDYASEQCAVMVRAIEHLSRALSALKSLRGIEQELVALKRLEDDGDRVMRDAIAHLFQNTTDPLDVIRWKDIHEALEDAIDAAETAANVVGNIAVKNA